MLRVRARARPHHPWVFANEVLDPPVAELPPGEAVEVADPKGRVLGRGYCNPHSLITIRIVTRGHGDVDGVELYRERLAAALELRARALPGRVSMRLCAGEADGLPGLVIDRYADVLAVQITTLGMERRKELLREAIEGVLKPRGAFLRDDAGSRALEGLPQVPGVWFGEVPERVAFDENGARFLADVRGGQKTGFFFDQAENRLFAAPRCAERRVLDVYAHSGAWAIHAMRAGATSATAVDSSAAACAGIRENAALNGVAVEVVEGDARDVMEQLFHAGERFDVVCVDPPAFAKNRKSAGAALGAYKAVNAAGLRLVRPGGLLFASSCSHHVHADRFEEAVLAGARQADRGVVLLRRGGQAPDHPILPGVPETEYLKHLVFGVR
ncbi:MAG: class I SAM-dependent rRNA methyltransferase [Myxococcota bacterium]